MTINAKEKITQLVNELLPMDNTIPCEHYRNERAVELFYKFSYFFNIKKLLRQYKREYLQYAIDAYTYPNGLIRLESYCVLNGEYAINQTIITDNLENSSAIIHVWNKYELKALQQFFIKSTSANSIFDLPYSKERGIEINETEVEIENSVIGRFTRLQKGSENTVYAEKYMPINKMLDCDLISKDISDTVELEVLYRFDDVPVFANILDSNGKSMLEEAPYNSNSYKDAKIVTKVAIDEVDAILKRTAMIINNYAKNDDEKQNETTAPVKVLK